MATQKINSLVGGADGQDTPPRNLSQEIREDALEEAVASSLARRMLSGY